MRLAEKGPLWISAANVSARTEGAVNIADSFNSPVTLEKFLWRQRIYVYSIYAEFSCHNHRESDYRE